MVGVQEVVGVAMFNRLKVATRSALSVGNKGK